MERTLTHFTSHNYPLQLLIFPEGTDLSDSNKAKSLEFAKLNNLAAYENVLHPRVKGFQYVISTLRENIDAVYDITLGFPDRIPQNEDSLWTGKLPQQVHFHVKRYAIKDIPREDDQVAAWCVKRWEEKEQLLKKFYEQKCFPNVYTFPAPQDRAFFFKQWFELVFWLSVVASCTYLAIISWWMRAYLLFAIIGELVISHLFGGAEQLEVSYHAVKQHQQQQPSASGQAKSKKMR